MKNIFLLPTDKPSYLFIIDKSKMFVPEAPYLSYTTVGGRVHKTEGSELYQPQNIYITSDEEIKEGDAYITKHGEICKSHNGSKILLFNTDKKIILTTVQDLINDGVQAIDDEFLEWFVKNPSCEEVEIDYQTKDFINECWVYDYKIIIQKEEQKQHIIEMMQNDEELGLYGANIIDTWLEKNGNPEIMKQVEREAELYQTINKIIDGGKNLPKGFEVSRGQAIDYAFDVALEVAEKLYTEEEIKEILFHRETEYLKTNSVLHIDKWFEQFSKLKDR